MKVREVRRKTKVKMSLKRQYGWGKVQDRKILVYDRRQGKAVTCD
jgi:hypothetical protein